VYKTIIAGALALATTAGPAFAQTAPAQGGGPFEGAYVGVQGGWQQDRQTLDTAGVRSGRVKAEGFAYGGQIGYDTYVGPNFVVGGELSVTGKTGRDDFGGFDLRQGRTLNATGRLGYTIAPNSLLYARGGYSNARFTVENATTRVSDNRGGYTVGGGLEQALGTNVSARVEYAYSHFGRDDLNSLFGPGSELNYSRHAVTAGLNYRF
jgi:outer membrane immunogenic protein